MARRIRKPNRLPHELRAEVLEVLAAVDREQLTLREAEQLVGFLQLQSAGAPPPSRATWFRRCAQLAALGLPVPQTPRELLA
jgi:hypothetical protein